MRILITGGTGFVGSALARRLIEAGHEVFCACRAGSMAPFGQTIIWDAAGPAGTANLPEAIDGLVHLAQSRRYRDFPADAREMFEVNVASTLSLLQWAVQTKVGRFCLVSSGTVYEPFGGQLQEDAAVSPGSFLGASKLASENIAKPFSGLLSLGILRLFFPFGPSQTDRLIPELIRRVRGGHPVDVTSNGNGMLLTPTFVNDVTEVILAGLEASWTGTVNVATPEVLSIRQIAEAIGRNVGIQPKFEIIDRSSIDIVPNLEKLAGRFSLNRFSPFVDALRLTIEAATTVT
jgi:UDP-glucose 4-epimerase